MRAHVSFALVAALVGHGCGSSDDSDRPASGRAVVPLSVEPRMPADARTYEDRRDRLRVKLPADWHRASDSATDRVSLVEGNILAVGTSPIRPRPDAACSDAADEPSLPSSRETVLV